MSEEKSGNSKKGFASNPQNINRSGRPKGSRNKATLLKAQLQIDSDTEYAAELWGALMRNDKEFLGITEDVPLTIRQKAALDIMNKAIANEKDKEPQEPAKTEKEEEDNTPIFSPTPVAQNS